MVFGKKGKPMAIKLVNNSEIVKIESEDSLLVERKFYEHQAGRDNIAFLMKDKDVNWEILQHSINVVEERFVELELLKNEMDKKYCPENLQKVGHGYEFLFDTEEMRFFEEV